MEAQSAGYSLTNANKASQWRGCGILTPARMREQAASESPVASPIALSENALKVRNYLAEEPGTVVVLAIMLARPAMIAQMLFGVGFAAFAPGPRARTRVLACGSLRCERLARCLDRA